MEKKYAYQKEAKKQADIRRRMVRGLRKMKPPKTWKEIGLMLNVSPQRAKQIGDGGKKA